MDKIIIFGTTVFSRDMKIIMENEGGIEVVAYTVNEQYIHETELDGIPVVPFETIEEHYSPEQYSILNTLGYAKMNDVREIVFNKIKEKGYANYTFISSRAILDSRNIGEGTIILPQVYIGPSVTIGRSNIIWNCASISHQVEIGDFNFISANAVLPGTIVLKDHCFLGINATLNNGVILAPYTFVGATAYIVSPTDDYGTYIGNPAKKTSHKSTVVIRLVGMFSNEK